MSSTTSGMAMALRECGGLEVGEVGEKGEVVPGPLPLLWVLSWFLGTMAGRHGMGRGLGSDSALEWGRGGSCGGRWNGSSLGVTGSLRPREVAGCSGS